MPDEVDISEYSDAAIKNNMQAVYGFNWDSFT